MSIITEDKDKRHCKRCSQLKDRKSVGKFPNLRNRKFVDETGKLWNGNVCGQCNSERMKEVMREKRAKSKLGV